MTSQDILSKIKKAFSAGQNQTGLELLREFNATTSATASSLNQQALIEEQIGDWKLAGRAHHACIEVAPQVASAYLYAAYWLEKNDSLDAAAALYSLAHEADPSIIHTNHDQVNKLTRALAGRQLLQSYLKQQHQAASAGEPRIERACWVQIEPTRSVIKHRFYQPQIFYIPDLVMQRFYPSNDFYWAKDLKSKTREIQIELAAALKNRAKLRPYIESTHAAPQTLQGLAGSENWSALDLYKDGVFNPISAELFPYTLKAIKELPTYGLDELPFEVFFSILKPGQVIAPHYGQSNHSLTVHLAIDIPNDCYLEVGDEKRTWQSGEIIIFDDNFLHSAYNNSGMNRVVLIFSIWHPDLSCAEQDAVKASFLERQQWMKGRRNKLKALLGDE